MQIFDIHGKFLGEHKYGGQFFNVTFDKDGNQWGTVHPKDVPLDQEATVVKFDKAGKMLGKIDIRSHELGIGLDGTILPASRSEHLIIFRPKH
jgi:hypothetical protein